MLLTLSNATSNQENQKNQTIQDVTNSINGIIKGLQALETASSWPFNGVWTQSQYNQAINAGINATGVTTSCMTDSTCKNSKQTLDQIAKDLSDAQYRNLSPCLYHVKNCPLSTQTPEEKLTDLTQTMEWFSWMAALVSNNSTERTELINDYKTFLSLLSQQTYKNFQQLFPTTSQAMQPAPTFTTPNTLSFNYQNFANAIKAVDTTRTSLVPMMTSFNRFNKPYANRSYNGSLLLGYQSFFSKHFGYSIQGSVGYGYIGSPLFKMQYFGVNALRNLQDVSVNLGADLYWDFNAPKNNTAAFYGLFVGLSGGSMNYDLSAQSDIWRASYDFDLDLGLRFQFGANIFKVGADIPLLKHNINWQIEMAGHAPINFEMQQGVQSSGFFIQYDRIILWRASSFWATIHRHLKKRHRIEHIYDPYRF